MRYEGLEPPRISWMQQFGVWVAFQRDAAGKVTGFTSTGGGHDFEARRQK